MSRLSYRLQSVAFSIVEAIEPLASIANKWAINRVVKRARVRPHPLSTQHDYVSWAGLTDRKWSARHLPPVVRDNPPSVDALMGLFKRGADGQRMCPKSTCLFPAFAQYLTDGFIRTESEGLTVLGDDPKERIRRNTSNHEIDMCTLYGRTKAQTDQLRLKSSTSGEKGRLKSQIINGEEYSPYFYIDGVRDLQFDELDEPLGTSKIDAERKAQVFAVGGDRVNSVPQVAMINTLFLREHNRLAAEIEASHPSWSDDRVFETARNTIIVIFIKIVVEDYINHISPMPFSLRADPSVAWKAVWNKPNWITTEFSLLYRWHALIPDKITWGGQTFGMGGTRMKNALLTDGGLLQAFTDMSAAQAAELGPRNTAEFLLDVEKASIEQDRHCALASFSDYCDYLGQRRPNRFSDISSDTSVVRLLAAHYSHPREVDFHVGLFCQDRVANSPLPPIVLMFVALDAFSQALTNPLLSQHVYKRSTFSRPGWSAVKNTKTLADVLDRNTDGGIGDAFVGMTRKAWVPE